MTKALISPKANYGYIPGLNGIRAISVLIVLIAHMGFQHIVPGGFGVTVFFFISGFLITRLLIAENETKGRIELKQFYIRRFIRLYPALLFMVFGTTFIYSLLGWGGPKFGELFSAIFYGMNIYHVNVVAGSTETFMPWTHLWSLAVEEHFYLIFPAFLVLMTAQWERILKGLVVLLGAVFAWRVIILTQTSLPLKDYTYMMTDTRIDSLVWGCLLSIMVHVNPREKTLSCIRGYVPVGLAVAAILTSFLIRDDAFRYTMRFSLQGLALFILFYNVFFTSMFKWVVSILEWKPLVWIGTISYALYLWHVPLIRICVRYYGEGPLSYGVAMVSSFYAAAFSYDMVEKRFLRFRKVFGSHGIVKAPL